MSDVFLARRLSQHRLVQLALQALVMRQPGGHLRDGHVRLGPRAIRRRFQRQVLRLEQPHFFRQRVALDPEHLGDARRLAVEHRHALELHRLHPELPPDFGGVDVGVFHRRTVRREQIVVPLAKIRELSSSDGRVGHRGVAQVPQRADLPVPRPRVLLPQAFEVLLGLGLESLDLAHEPLLVFIRQLGVTGGELLAQIVRLRSQRPRLLPQAVLLFLPPALALARRLHLARQVRLVLLEQLALVPAGLELRRQSRLLLSKDLSLGRGARGFLLSLRRALGEAVDGGGHLVVHRALGGEDLHLDERVLEIAAEAIAASLQSLAIGV